MYTLITGATSGIGLDLAYIFAKNSNNLILVARNKEKLEELKIKLLDLIKFNHKDNKNIDNNLNIDIIIISMDISGESNAKNFYSILKSKNLNTKINLFINNAGIGSHGYFHDKDLSYDINQIDLNITTPTVLTKLFIQDIKNNESSVNTKNYYKIFNIASTASFQSGPLMSVYYATKSYLLNFSEGLSEELRDTNIKVVTLCPGPTKTNFEMMKNIDIDLNKKSIKNFHIASSKSVARFLYDNLNTNKDILIHKKLNQFMIFITKFLPRKLNLKLIKQIQEKKER